MNTHDWLGKDEEDNNYRILSTLNPTYLKSTDYTSLSHHLNPSISFVPRTPSFTVRFFQKAGKHQPFPPRTRGFFYYHSPLPGLPSLAGGLRFRLSPRSHPSSFSDGVDLLHEGVPWQISLGSIAAAVGRKAVLREHLLLEGLVTQADLDRCRAASPNKKRLDHKITLFRLKQPFPIAFDRGLHAWIVGSGETSALRWTYAYMFADNRMSMRPFVRPYSGSALAQFEFSTLPEHANGTVIVFRIVKMLEPPSCVLDSYDDAIPMPVEGDLVRRPMGHGRSSHLQPWFCDLTKEDSDSAAALRVLVEV
ncbi:hypothetical protein C8F04DRAFT_965057 [Mycena alexandri]|uniref:Uncharacterized protein n=1 Tax=Mycena alexandri TaxID=1745969 RepID=A0AAD6SJX4_9AGAR|nr:hypothetical protein C8F04DRAFT_965057 [Mycena alexandri]